MVFDLHKGSHCRGKAGKGFTLLELMVVLSIISLLLSVLLPSLRKSRQQAQAVICMNNIKQLGLAFILYGEDYNGYAMPSAVQQTSLYWWGKKLSDGIDHKQGFVWPYLKSGLGRKSVYECPAQPYGSYKLQGMPAGEKNDPKWITSTYGYNGYFLCPSQSGWPNLINLTDLWQKIINISSPSTVLVFADTLIDLGPSGGIQNNFSLDPPKLYREKDGKWFANQWPTTCFRHNEKTNAIFVDGHSEPITTKGAAYTSPQAKIGSIGTNNAPYYVPNYLQWPKRMDRKR
jgi:prepilin-type N-terminal cleavage/methylation domain-containing protein/prepilin-type processing-associated H-X9-DG protein